MSRSRSFLILRLKVRGLPKILRTHLLPDINLTGTGMQATLKVVNYCLLILGSHTSTCTSSQSSRFKGIVCSIFVESFYFYLLNTLWRNEFSRNLSNFRVNVMKGCMTFRTSWWPQYHFSSTYNCSSQLSFHKAVCCHLMDPSSKENSQKLFVWIQNRKRV